jgi:SHS2 domain-containing protein
VTVEGAGPEERLVRWLREWHWLHESEGFLAAEAVVDSLSASVLSGSASGERRDPSRHPALREIKAVTWHQVRVEGSPGGPWRAQVIFDV